MSISLSPRRLWWFADSALDAAWCQRHGYEVVGSGRGEPLHAVEIIICDGISREELKSHFATWRLRSPAPLVFSTGAELEGVVFLPDSLFAEYWPMIIALALAQQQSNRQLQRLQAEQLTLRSRLSAAESQLRDRQEELVRLETQAAMSQLVRSLAHELNNPLAVILGNAELMQRNSNPDPLKHQRRAQSIIDEIGSCQLIIESLRKHCRPQGEAANALSVQQVMAQAFERLRRRGSPLPDVHVEGEIPMVFCGRLALVRAVEQILDNALRAGAAKVTLSAVVDQVSGQCEIHFSNDGFTPSEGDIRDAFRPFFSATEGAGLGLTLALSLLSEYRGSLTLKVGPGGSGATTTVRLPLWDKATAKRAADAASSDELTPPSLRAVMPMLLVVEDSAMLAEMIVAAAEAEGWMARVVGTYAEAEQTLAEAAVGALLLEASIGDQRGLALVREYLKRFPRQAPAVLVMSADQEGAELRQLIKDWGCQVIAKPFRGETLRNALRQVYVERKKR